MYHLKRALIPYPQIVEDHGGTVTIGRLCSPDFCLITDSGIASPIYEEAIRSLKQLFTDRLCIDEFPCRRAEGTYPITLMTDAEDGDLRELKSEEAYSIRITTAGTKLCGKTAAGAFYAAVTFGQLLHTEGNEARLPLCTIIDYPDFARRGNYIECRYGTEFLTREDWMHAIDCFAAMKNNQLTIGVYGCWADQYDDLPSQYLYLPLHAYPELKTPKDIRYFSVSENRWICRRKQLPSMFAEDYFGDLVAYGKRKNVTVKPLFNSLGHNRLIPTVFPEVSAKKEDGTPSARGFCTRNEHTFELLFNIYDEIIDRYLTPNGVDSFHIGMDEVTAASVCHCPACRDSSHKELMFEFIIKLCKHLKAKGMKSIYIYHDMLYNSFQCVNEELKERLIREDLYDNIVLDWWSYEDPNHLFWDKVDGVNGLFRSVIKPFTGYYHWAIPTENNPNILACARLARQLNFEGIEAYGSLNDCYDKNYLYLAEAAWNTEKAMDERDFDRRYATLRFPNTADAAVVALDAMRIAMEDETHASYMNSVCYKLEYYHYCYRQSKQPTLKPFPKAVFDQVLFPEPERFRDYLQLLLEKSTLAVDFFENRSRDVGHFNDMWLLSAKHYQAIADEYLTLWTLLNDERDGVLDTDTAVCALDRLLLQRERLMACAETVRIPATRYTYLRNMSVFRQFYTELRAHLKETGTVSLDLPESDIFRFLR